MRRRSMENRRAPRCSGETLSINICARKNTSRDTYTVVRMRHARFFSAIKWFAAYISPHDRIFIDSLYVSARERRYSIIGFARAIGRNENNEKKISIEEKRLRARNVLCNLKVCRDYCFTGNILYYFKSRICICIYV